MKVNITKHKEEYVINKDGEQLAKVKTYRNPYHLSNCYVDFDLYSVERIDERNIFKMISEEEKSPLQVMLSSLETQKANFLASQGFIKVRMCHEMEVNKKDLLSGLPSRKSKIFKANRDQSAYNECSNLLFNYYKETHETINPLTATFDTFIKDMTTEVFYAKSNDNIQHVAFIEDNEIAYICSRDEIAFDSFALSVIDELLVANQSIIFEADNVDWAAMRLKNLFQTDSNETFDTWVYKK